MAAPPGPDGPATRLLFSLGAGRADDAIAALGSSSSLFPSEIFGESFGYCMQCEARSTVGVIPYNHTDPDPAIAPYIHDGHIIMCSGCLSELRCRCSRGPDSPADIEQFKDSLDTMVVAFDFTPEDLMCFVRIMFDSRPLHGLVDKWVNQDGDTDIGRVLAAAGFPDMLTDAIQDDNPPNIASPHLRRRCHAKIHMTAQ